MSTADVKYKIIQLYNMEMDYQKIAKLTKKTERYVATVLEEYFYHGTITVNSRLNKL